MINKRKSNDFLDFQQLSALNKSEWKATTERKTTTFHVAFFGLSAKRKKKKKKNPFIKRTQSYGSHRRKSVAAQKADELYAMLPVWSFALVSLQIRL